MHPSLHFHYCPACGAAREATRRQPVKCAACGFTLYMNTTCATGAFLRRADGRVLFIRRGHEPAKGMLAVPGGFIDEGETAEQGLQREFMEEVGVTMHGITFLCSHPNSYLYEGVTYPVLDFFFTATAGHEEPAALDAVESFCWLDPAAVQEEDMAFPSMAFALRKYKETDQRRNFPRVSDAGRSSAAADVPLSDAYLEK
jgi:ADP-ribose pyrophosphatase YjhB (NUDIX family)